MRIIPVQFFPWTAGDFPFSIGSALLPFYFEVTEKMDVVHFNLSGGHAEEFIVKAEIRLKLPKNPLQWPHGSHSRVLTLYDVTTQKQASRAVHLDANQQWAVFPVRSLVKRWLRFPQTNHGVQLVLKNGKTGRHESLERVPRGLRQRPLQLVIFANDKLPQMTETSFKRYRCYESKNCSILTWSENIACNFNAR